MTKEEAYDILLYWVERFVDYNLQVPADYTDEDGNPSDAVTLKRCLETLPERWPKQQKTKSKPEPKKMTYIEWLNNPDFKDYIYTIRKEARESINPNYRYCVVNDDVDECYLTDDIGVAMEFAANKSKADTHSWGVCNIVKAGDGSYITTIEGHCMRGHYIDDDRRTFLHFDYISQRCEGGVKKI
jgi:hypothetical protein